MPGLVAEAAAVERGGNVLERCAEAVSSASQASRAFSADNTNISPGTCGSQLRSTFNATSASMTLYSSLPILGSI